MSYAPRWTEEDGVMKPLISFLHVLPIESKDLPHCAQLCCWCSPKPDESDPVVIIHNAMTEAREGWVVVGEMTMPADAEPACAGDQPISPGPQHPPR